MKVSKRGSIFLENEWCEEVNYLLNFSKSSEGLTDVEALIILYNESKEKFRFN